MSSSPDPQTWVFPPLGAAVLPSNVSASFGPISQGDKIKLEWAPASSTPEITFRCGIDPADDTRYSASDGNPSPYIFEFDLNVNNGSGNLCWFFFPGTFLGNTLTFAYNNEGNGSSTLWEQDSQLAQAMSGGGGSAATTTITSTETKTIIVTGTTIGTGTSLAAAATAAATCTSGLSAGAAAGITTAAIIVFTLLFLLGWVLHSRRNKKNVQNGGSILGPGIDNGPVLTKNYRHS